MSIKEVNMFLDAHSENRKLQAKEIKAQMYNTAYLTASFVGYILSGKQIPSMSTVFEDEEGKPKQDNRWLLWKEQLQDFALEANKRRKAKEVK